MRPVVRGAHPQNGGGADVLFTDHQHARPYLIQGIGGYCSYCEMKLDSGLAVEHIISQHQDGTLALSWTNFLLSCTNCNSTKGTTVIAIGDYYWPHSANTFRAIAYGDGGTVTARPPAGSDDAIRAQRTIELVGLHRRHVNATLSDRRWIERREAWEIAKIWRARYESEPNGVAIDAIVDLARKGYWSVWLTVFNGIPAVIARLIAAMPGTAPGCFDADGNPTPRPNGPY